MALVGYERDGQFFKPAPAEFMQLLKRAYELPVHVDGDGDAMHQPKLLKLYFQGFSDGPSVLPGEFSRRKDWHVATALINFTLNGRTWKGLPPVLKKAATTVLHQPQFVKSADSEVDSKDHGASHPYDVVFGRPDRNDQSGTFSGLLVTVTAQRRLRCLDGTLI